MRSWCVFLVLAWAANVWAANDPILFPGGTQPTQQRRRPNRRPDLKVPCATCGQISKRQSAVPKVPQVDTSKIQDSSEPNEIPLEFYQKLNEIEDEFQFLALMGAMNGELVNASGLYNVEAGSAAIRISRAGEIGFRQGEGGEEIDIPPGTSINDERRPVVEIAKQANCSPENTTVPLIVANSSENPFTIQYPTCVRVQRCNGCCNTDVLNCEPTEIRLRSLSVILTDFNNKKLSNPRRRTVVDVEEHLGCKCVCRMKAEHCNSLQVYNQKACRCICMNDDDKEKCNLESKIKVWDMDTCLCKCRELSECSTGFYFDEKTCSCKSDSLFYSRYENKPRVPGSDYQLSPWEQITGARRSLS